MRVLVIDDEQIFLETLAARLKLRGIEARGCLDAREGIALIKSQEFDAAILDVSMPDMDGIQALKIIKNEKPELPVILLTGHASLSTAKTGMKAGAFDYLLKPFPLDDLLDRLEEARRI